MPQKRIGLMQLVSLLIKNHDINISIQDLGSSINQRTGHEESIYDIRLQGNIISTEADSFEYTKIGPVDPYPQAWKVIRDLTEFSVYGYSKNVAGFVLWIQEMSWEDSIGSIEKINQIEPTYRLKTIQHWWDEQWQAVKRMEDWV